jgi:hypothetical protein
MVFLSHNQFDKDVVGPVAIHLANRYGKDNVFYDSWTVRPGDSIIGSMSEGLRKCKYFFFFISENSLKSALVSLEWQNALIKSAKEGIKFVPIKMDDSDQPAILIDKLYINMYEDGLDTTIGRIIDVIENRDSSIYNAHFHNIVYKIEKVNDSEYTVTLIALKFIERDATILFAFKNPTEDITVKITPDGTQMTHDSSGKIGEENFIGIFLSSRPLTPKNPIVYKVSSKSSETIDGLRLYHQTDKNSAQLLGIITYL